MSTRTVPRHLPLTSMQQALLAPALLGPGNGFDVEQLVWSINEWVDVPVLQRAWTLVHERHDALRLIFHVHDEDMPGQSVVEQAAPVISRRQIDGAWQEQALALERFLEADRRTPFDFTVAPLSRLTLLSFAQDCHHAVWTFPHVLLDGRSISVILEDLVDIYRSLCAGLVIGKEAAPAFAEYLEFRSEPHALSADYWQSLLGGSPPRTPSPRIPRPQRGRPTTRPSKWTSAMPMPSTRRCSCAPPAWGCRSPMCCRPPGPSSSRPRSGQQDVVFGSIRACRHAGPVHVRQASGVFMNCLPKRIQVDPAMTVRQLVTALHRQQLAMRAPERDALDAVARFSGIARGGRLFDSILMVDKEPVHAAAARLVRSARHAFRLHEKPCVPIAVNFTTTPHLVSTMIVDPRRVSRNGALRLIAQLKHAVLQLAEHPSATLGTLRLMPAAEYYDLVSAYNASEAPIDSDRCLHQLFEREADRDPERIAVIDSRRRWTYGEIEGQANRLAHRLIASGVGPGAVVAVLLERSADQVIALLAVLKAGAAYVPCDADHPVERLRWLLDSTAAAALVTNPRSAKPALRHPNTLTIDARAPEDGGGDGGRPGIATASDSLAYIMFTSGSTGTPKGVMISHRGAVNTIIDCNTRFQVTGADRILAISSYTFDLSVYDIFGMLAAGAALVICPPQAARDPETWADLVRREGITLWNSVPALVEMLVAFQRGSPARLASLRLVMMSGDWIPVTLPRALAALLPGVEQYSLGGATEASIWSIIHRIGPEDGRRRSIPMGGRWPISTVLRPRSPAAPLPDPGPRRPAYRRHRPGAGLLE